MLILEYVSLRNWFIHQFKSTAYLNMPRAIITASYNSAGWPTQVDQLNNTQEVVSVQSKCSKVKVDALLSLIANWKNLVRKIMLPKFQ